MSTTVTYKNETLTTVSNNTKTLKTAGKYMEGDVVLTDVSASSPTIQSLSITPTESVQTFNASGVDGYKPVSVSAISSTYVGSAITQRSSSSLSVSGATVLAPAGYYAENATTTVSELTLPTSTAASATSGYTLKATVGRSASDQYINIGTGYNLAGGYYKISAVANGSATGPTSLSGSSATVSTGTNTLTLTKTGVTTTPTVSAGYVSSATASTATVALTASVTTQAAKTVTPTESEQTAVAANVYTTGIVKVGAISSTYVGSDITVDPELTISGRTVTVPAGYYSTQVTGQVSTMTLPTSAASSATSGYTSKATISRSTSAQYINIPPGYNSAGAYYVISAVPNGSLSYSGWTETESDGVLTMTMGKTFTAGYLSSAPDVDRTFTNIVDTTITPSTTQQVVSRLSGNTFIKRVTVEAMPSGSATAPASISGTAATVSTGTNTLTLTKTVSVTPTVSAGYVSAGTAGNSSVSLTASVTVNPTPTASGATVTIPAGYYSSQTTKSVTSGSASAPSTISGTSATVSTGTNTLTLTKTVSVTPTVSAGYVSAGTATNSSVSLTASVTTKAAATITPTTTNQTIASGTYLTGTQTIAGDADLVASNIISGVQIFGVTGNVVLQNVYTGSSAPSSSTGANGDIYIQS